MRHRTLPVALLALVLAAAPALPTPAAAQRPEQSAAAAPIRPDTTGYLDVEGVRLYYESYGDIRSATPLLILHGGFMHAEQMRPLAAAFREARPVILLDQRAHGRSTDADPLTYSQLGDDAAAAVDALGLERADVLGYSMGGGAALQMAIRHPDRVGKLVLLGATYRRDGWYPEVLQAIGSMDAAAMAQSPLGSEYRRVSPTPDRFPRYFERVKQLNYVEQDIPDEQIRAIRAPTMIIVGDADGVRPEHAVRLFRLRGGGDPQAAATGMLTTAPTARLAVMPAGSHIGLLGMIPEIARDVEAFLTDAPPPPPVGFGGAE